LTPIVPPANLQAAQCSLAGGQGVAMITTRKLQPLQINNEQSSTTPAKMQICNNHSLGCPPANQQPLQYGMRAVILVICECDMQLLVCSLAWYQQGSNYLWPLTGCLTTILKLKL